MFQGLVFISLLEDILNTFLQLQEKCIHIDMIHFERTLWYPWY